MTVVCETHGLARRRGLGTPLPTRPVIHSDIDLVSMACEAINAVRDPFIHTGTVLLWRSPTLILVDTVESQLRYNSNRMTAHCFTLVGEYRHKCLVDFNVARWVTTTTDRWRTHIDDAPFVICQTLDEAIDCYNQLTSGLADNDKYLTDPTDQALAELWKGDPYNLTRTRVEGAVGAIRRRKNQLDLHTLCA